MLGDDDAMTNADQDELVDFLRRNCEPSVAARAILKRTIPPFVLDYGWWYKAAKLPKGIAMGTPKECHKNAADLALADDSLIYCEGYALFKSQAVLHAWVTDRRGRAIDNTWTEPGVAYAGVPFQTDFVNLTMLTNHAFISLLDDYRNRFPLRGDLGDRPDEWLELRGRGVAPICKPVN